MADAGEPQPVDESGHSLEPLGTATCECGQRFTLYRERDREKLYAWLDEHVLAHVDREKRNC